MKYSIYIFILLCLVFEGCAQTRTKTGKKAKDLYASCLALYQEQKWSAAQTCLNQIDPSAYNQEYHDLAGSVAMAMDHYAEAEAHFLSAIQFDSLQSNKFLYYKYGLALWHQHQYLSAQTQFNIFQAFNLNLKPNISEALDYYIKSAGIADSLYQLPRSFDPRALPPQINSSEDELNFSMSADQTLAIITRRGRDENIFQTHFKEGQWSDAQSLEVINSPDNEGGVSLSGDGQSMVFTACNRSDGKGSCDLYFSQQLNGQWTAPIPLASINSRYWESQPCLSLDGRALIFSSDRPGGYGGRDLWLTVKNEDGKWIVPINLGNTINSTGHEENPYLHPDQHSLYFTSDFHPGFGRKDLFMSYRIKGNTWTQPENLGFPINSHKDEQGIFVSADGQWAYYASDVSGNFDIYSFKMDTAIMPEPLKLVDLVVADQETKEILPQATVEILDLSANSLLHRISTDEKGRFRFLIHPGQSYGINIRESGYVLYSQQWNNRLFHQRDTLFLQPIVKRNTPIILENIFFASGEATLLPTSTFELDRLTAYLAEQPELKIEIIGHTDNIGSSEDNVQLSEARAEAVKNYLVNRGIAEERLQTLGQGDRFPIADNDTAEGRAKNRRTEFLIK